MTATASAPLGLAHGRWVSKLERPGDVLRFQFFRAGQGARLRADFLAAPDGGRACRRFVRGVLRVCVRGKNGEALSLNKSSQSSHG